MIQPGHNELNELNEMVNLVEEVTHRIDELHLRSNNLQSRAYAYWAIAYTCLSASGGFVAAMDQFFKVASDDFRFIGIALFVFIAGATIFFVFLATKVSRGRKAVIRELQRERLIQQEVISMVDEQIRRLKSFDVLSKISFATLGVRLSRLDRGDQYFEKSVF